MVISTRFKYFATIPFLECHYLLSGRDSLSFTFILPDPGFAANVFLDVNNSWNKVGTIQFITTFRFGNIRPEDYRNNRRNPVYCSWSTNNPPPLF